MLPRFKGQHENQWGHGAKGEEGEFPFQLRVSQPPRPKSGRAPGPAAREVASPLALTRSLERRDCAERWEMALHQNKHPLIPVGKRGSPPPHTHTQGQEEDDITVRSRVKCSGGSMRMAAWDSRNRPVAPVATSFPGLKGPRVLPKQSKAHSR